MTLWLATTVGFFSIVEKSWDKEKGTLTVRARVREDLENLIKIWRDRYPRALTEPEIIEDEQADYRYRIQFTRQTWAYLMTDLVRDIDYDNFKNAVATEQGVFRSRLYSKVWAVLLELQTRVFKGRNHVQ